METQNSLKMLEHKYKYTTIQTAEIQVQHAIACNAITTHRPVRLQASVHADDTSSLVAWYC